MGRSVEVVVSELYAASTRLEYAGQRLQDGLSNVDMVAGQMVGSGWQGDAASAFGMQWENWRNAAGQVVLGLQTMSDLLSLAGKEYAKIDEQSADAISGSLHDTTGSEHYATNSGRSGERPDRLSGG